MNQQAPELQRLRDRLAYRRHLLEMALPHVRDDHVANLIREELKPPQPLSGETLDEVVRTDHETPGAEGTRRIQGLLRR